jgi:hypothetical protein
VRAVAAKPSWCKALTAITAAPGAAHFDIEDRFGKSFAEIAW